MARASNTGKGGRVDRGAGGGVGTQVRIKLTLPERILIVRRRLGMSQRDLAALIGVSEFTICRNERGKRLGTGTWSGDVRHKFRLVEARYKLMIEEANGK